MVDNVLTGYWVDQAEGVAYGRVITLPSQNALFLISFLALFIGIVSSHSWCKYWISHLKN